jgi:hypothetical protein
MIFNLLVAHYRDGLGGPEPEAAMTNSVIEFRTHPFELHDVNSWLLFGLGLIFSVISLSDGLAWDDPYPGYGSVARRHRMAQDEYAGEKEALIDEVEEIRDDAVKDLTEKGRAILAGLDEYRQIGDQRSALKRAFEAHLDQLQAAAGALMQFYRQENLRARGSGAGSPAHFGRKWIMNRTQLDDDGSISLQVPHEVIIEKLDGIPKLTRDVIDTANGEISRYKRIVEQYGIANAEA